MPFAYKIGMDNINVNSATVMTGQNPQKPISMLADNEIMLAKSDMSIFNLLLGNLATEVISKDLIENSNIITNVELINESENIADSPKIIKDSEKEEEIIEIELLMPIDNYNILAKTMPVMLENQCPLVKENTESELINEYTEGDTSISYEKNNQLFEENNIKLFNSTENLEINDENTISENLRESPEFQLKIDKNNHDYMEIKSENLIEKNKYTVLPEEKNLTQINIDYDIPNANDQDLTKTSEFIINITENNNNLDKKSVVRKENINISKKKPIENEDTKVEVPWKLIEINNEERQIISINRGNVIEQDINNVESARESELQGFEMINDNRVPINHEKFKSHMSVSSANNFELDTFEVKSMFDQLQMQIAHVHDEHDNSQKITLQLYPRELGTIEVKIFLNNKHNQHNNIIYVFVERPQTLELFKQDIQCLEQNLQNLGILADSNNINLSLEYKGSGMNKNYHNEQFEPQIKQAGDFYKQADEYKILPINNRINHRQLDIVV